MIKGKINNKINKYSPSPISIEKNEKIIKQMKNSVFKIIMGNDEFTTGFFCKIPYDSKLLPVLVINSNIMTNNLKKNNFILISLNNENIKIEINDSRKIIENKKIDFTFIEILPDIDHINIEYFLELDENVINLDRSIYIIHYQNKNLHISYGMLSNIRNYDFYTINHLCHVDKNSFGSPILSLETLKVIGINIEYNQYKEYDDLELCLEEDFCSEHFENNGILFNLPSLERNLKEINLIYYLDKNNISEGFESIKMFGEKFVENNKDNCRLIINFEEKELSSYYNIIIDSNKHFNRMKIKYRDMLYKKELKVKLIEIKPITDMSHMFDNCTSISSLPDISKFDTINITNMSYIFYNFRCLSFPNILNWKTENVTNMSGMFSKCQFIYSCPDISNWNISKVKDISYMFNDCSFYTLSDISKWDTSNISNMSNLFSGNHFSSLPDISKWNTSNVTNMSEMFYNISDLTNFPDISKWNVDNVTDMSKMFAGCFSLLSFPDISNWNISKVTNLFGMFSYCNKILSLPDISHWNTINVKNMSFLFSNYEKTLNLHNPKLENYNNYYFFKDEQKSLLNYLPDISRWNTKNVNDMSYMFYGCESLISLPDISNWNTENVIDMSNMYNGCSSLLTLPDISKWNTNNVNKMNSFFYECSSLSFLHNISKWNTINVQDMSKMFYGCISLLYLPDISKWDISNLKEVNEMFYQCLSLSFLPNFSKLNKNDNVSKVNIFNGCFQLINVH